MQYDVQEVSNSTRKLTIRVESKELRGIEKKVIQKLRKEVHLPGFRPGRVPETLIRRRFGDTLKAQMVDQTINTYYEQVLNEANLRPIAPGQLTDLKFDSVEEGMEFEIEVEVEPKVELRKYKGLKVEKDKVEVTEEMIEHALQELQFRFATAKTAEEVKEGYVVRFDLQAIGEGNVPVLGKKLEDAVTRIGSGEFASLEPQMIGMKVGESRYVEDKPPASPDPSEDRPPVERYLVTVKSIEEWELPPIDDELAINLGLEDVETLEDLKAYLRDRIAQQLEQEAEKTLERRLIDELLKENPFEVPELMVENYLQIIVEDLKRQHPDEQIDEELVRTKYRPEAIHILRWHLLKEAIIQAENLSVSDEEVMEYIDALNISPLQKQHFKKQHQQWDEIRTLLLHRKVIEVLKSHAEIEEVPPRRVTQAPDFINEGAKESSKIITL